MAKEYKIRADFDLPVVREHSPPAPELSMDGYDRWIQQERRTPANQAALREALKRPGPVTPFVISD